MTPIPHSPPPDMGTFPCQSIRLGTQPLQTGVATLTGGSGDTASAGQNGTKGGNPPNRPLGNRLTLPPALRKLPVAQAPEPMVVELPSVTPPLVTDAKVTDAKVMEPKATEPVESEPSNGTPPRLEQQKRLLRPPIGKQQPLLTLGDMETLSQHAPTKHEPEPAPRPRSRGATTKAPPSERSIKRTTIPKKGWWEQDEVSGKHVLRQWLDGMRERFPKVAERIPVETDPHGGPDLPVADLKLRVLAKRFAQLHGAEGLRVIQWAMTHWLAYEDRPNTGRIPYLWLILRLYDELLADMQDGADPIERQNAKYRQVATQVQQERDRAALIARRRKPSLGGVEYVPHDQPPGHGQPARTKPAEDEDDIF